ncbi:MAG: ZIP family metal transporter, partial [Methanobacteriota archaeon]
MALHPELPVLGLAALAASADLVGGYFVLTRRRLADARYLIAFSSGIVIAAVFAELVPHAFEGVEEGLSVDGIAFAMALGFFLFYLAEKLVMLHACGEAECETHTVGTVAVIGLALDNVVDGIGIAVGYLVDPLLGVVITLAVVAPEVPQGIASAELLARAGA